MVVLPKLHSRFPTALTKLEWPTSVGHSHSWTQVVAALSAAPNCSQVIGVMAISGTGR